MVFPRADSGPWPDINILIPQGPTSLMRDTSRRQDPPPAPGARAAVVLSGRQQGGGADVNRVSRADSGPWPDINIPRADLTHAGSVTKFIISKFIITKFIRNRVNT